MHTCLSLSNVDCHSRVEEHISNLADRLGAFCESIDSCHISIEQVNGESGGRYWRLTLCLRIFDESVRATTSQPTGIDPAHSLAHVLDDIYARAIERMTQVAKRRYCSCAGLTRHVASHYEECLT